MTFKEFFLANLPEKVAQQAIENTREDIRTYPIPFELNTPLTGAFIWDLTKEGREYWETWNELLQSKAEADILIY